MEWVQEASFRRECMVFVTGPIGRRVPFACQISDLAPNLAARDSVYCDPARKGGVDFGKPTPEARADNPWTGAKTCAVTEGEPCLAWSQNPWRRSGATSHEENLGTND
jgi:hypothetical protein